MEIREIRECDRNTAAKLIEAVFLQFEAPDSSEEGIQSFKDTAIYNTNFMNSLMMYGAYVNTTLVGVIATREEGSHIALFFVEGKYHRQGIGTLLFEKVLQASTRKEITVHSSPYAVEVYHRLGFVDTASEQETAGIKYTPMVYRR